MCTRNSSQHPSFPGSCGQPKRTRSGAQSSLARQLIWKHRQRLLLGLILLLLGRLASAVLPALSKFVVDDVIGGGRREILPYLAVVGAAAALLQAVLGFTVSQMLGVAAQRAVTDIRTQVHAKMVGLPIRFFDSTQAGTLLARIMNDAEGIRNLVGAGLVQLAGGLLTAAIAFGVLVYLNWRLTCVTAVILALFGGGIAYALNHLRPLARERNRIYAEMSGRLSQGLAGIRVVKSFAAEKHEEVVFTKNAHRLFRNIARSVSTISTTTSGAAVIVGALGVTMLWLGGNDVIAGRMTVGDLITYVLFVALLAVPLIAIANIGTQIVDALAGLDRISEILDMPAEDEGDRAKAPLGPIVGDIVFDNVWFEYEPGRRVLKGVSFRAEPGTTTALVGSSGSGKSTLVSLVMAFGAPVSGAIRVDGRELSTVPLRDYRAQVASVLQESVLFDGTVAANIGFARPSATRDEIEDAARAAHCEEFIRAFDHGYDTAVGERGVELSGGQRQRISIARAILARPRILVLDEATSSLDSETEEMIQASLQTLWAGRTTFVIAHRFSTIRSADQILVLDDGEIVERGTHDELLAGNGRYRQLHDKQYRLRNGHLGDAGTAGAEPSRA